jgi:hypothetical protein
MLNIPSGPNSIASLAVGNASEASTKPECNQEGLAAKATLEVCLVNIGRMLKLMFIKCAL